MYSMSKTKKWLKASGHLVWAGDQQTTTAISDEAPAAETCCAEASGYAGSAWWPCGWWRNFGIKPLGKPPKARAWRQWPRRIRGRRNQVLAFPYKTVLCLSVIFSFPLSLSGYFVSVNRIHILFVSSWPQTCLTLQREHLRFTHGRCPIVWQRPRAVLTLSFHRCLSFLLVLRHSMHIVLLVGLKPCCWNVFCWSSREGNGEPTVTVSEEDDEEGDDLDGYPSLLEALSLHKFSDNSKSFSKAVYYMSW